MRLVVKFALGVLLLVSALPAFSQTQTNSILVSDFANLSGDGFNYFFSWFGGTPSADQFLQNSGFVSIQGINGGNPTEDGFAQKNIAGPAGTNVNNLQIELTAKLAPGNGASQAVIFLLDSDGTELDFSFPLLVNSPFNASTFTTSKIFVSPTNGVQISAGSDGVFDLSHVTTVGLAGIDGGTNDFRIFYDNLSLTVVPEPSTLGLGLLGLSACVFRLRRLNRRS